MSALNECLTHPQVQLNRECPFWDENSLCGNEQCSVDPVNEVRHPLCAATHLA
jgi:hypothetical protein